MANHTITKDTLCKHFSIRACVQPAKRKSRRYYVQNYNLETIAYIWWYAPWRQYCFYPGPETVWSLGCLADIQDFLTKLKGS